MINSAKIEQFHFDADINTIDYTQYPSEYPLHWHQYAELLAVGKPGVTACILVNQQTIRLGYGDILIIWPGDLHAVIDNHDKAIMALQFPMSLINQKREFARYSDSYRKNGLLQYSNSSEINDAILSDINRLLDISRNKDYFINVRMSIVLYEIFISIAAHYISNESSETGKAETNSLVNEKIQLACTYIMTHCDEPLTLSDVATQIGFSPCYFSRLFKKITTHSFVEYLTLQRINKLQVLLADSDLSITEAAYMAGFKSISTLNRTFSHHCGYSPSEFRKYYLN